MTALWSAAACRRFFGRQHLHDRSIAAAVKTAVILSEAKDLNRGSLLSHQIAEPPLRELCISSASSLANSFRPRSSR
jgi:hypothetical protein